MDDRKYMLEAIKLAGKAYQEGEVPVGAVIVQKNKIIAKAYNQKERRGSAVCHAEIIAIEKASIKKGDWRLDDCVMYVTLEPCAMCMGAILESRIKRVVYAVSEDKNKKLNKTVNKEQISDSATIQVSINMLKDFFINKRN